MTDREKLIELLEDVPVSYELCMRIKGHCPTTETPCYECLADYLLANGVTFAKDTWIRVEDGLPKEKIIIDGETYYRTVVVITENEFAAQKIAFYDEELMGWYQPNDIIPLRNVTHWMPLPEPPKEDTNGK